jgi:hypothetical protein
VTKSRAQLKLEAKPIQDKRAELDKREEEIAKREAISMARFKKATSTISDSTSFATKITGRHKVLEKKVEDHKGNVNFRMYEGRGAY